MLVALLLVVRVHVDVQAGHQDATQRRRCTARRPSPGPPAVETTPGLGSGNSRCATVSTRPTDEHEADAGQEDARELHAHLEAPDEDVAAAREDRRRALHVVRPNVIKSVTTKMVTSARPATKVRQRTRQTTIPTATKIVMTGNQWLRVEQLARRRASRGSAARRSRSRGPCPRGPGCAPPSATGASTGTMTQADAKSAAPPTSTARRSRRHRSDGTRKGNTMSGTKARYPVSKCRRDRHHDEEDGGQTERRTSERRGRGR